MMETAAKLKLFFSGFGLKAYLPQSVPEDELPPYITYDLTEPNWAAQGNTYCQIWYPKGHMAELLAKADEIMASIGEGVQIITPAGYIMLYLAQQQGQLLTDEWTNSVYIGLLINSYQVPGT